MSPQSAAPAGWEEAGAEFDAEQAALNTRSAHSLAGFRKERVKLAMIERSLLRRHARINPLTSFLTLFTHAAVRKAPGSSREPLEPIETPAIRAG